jgi:twitching motility protein PilU
LAISTLHANNANQALDRIINFFPEERRPQLLNDLGNNLKSFISQRLIPTVDGKRCAAIEVMMGTLTVRDMIKRGEFGQLKDVMEKSKQLGMQTFDGALFDLAVAGKITEEEAINNSDSPTNLTLKFKLHHGGIAEQAEENSKKDGGLSLEPMAPPFSDELTLS